MYIDKEELFAALEEAYGNLNNDGGCYYSKYNDDGGAEYEWLSIKRIVDIIEDCIDYNESDF